MTMQRRTFLQRLLGVGAAVVVAPAAAQAVIEPEPAPPSAEPEARAVMVRERLTREQIAAMYDPPIALDRGHGFTHEPPQAVSLDGWRAKHGGGNDGLEHGVAFRVRPVKDSAAMRLHMTEHLLAHGMLATPEDVIAILEGKARS